MLGCPHYTIEQIWEVSRLLEGRKISPNSELWIFTPRQTKALALVGQDGRGVTDDAMRERLLPQITLFRRHEERKQ